jgi:hypothetical protein
MANGPNDIPTPTPAMDKNLVYQFRKKKEGYNNQGSSPIHNILFVLIHAQRDKTEGYSGDNPAEGDGIFGLTIPWMSLKTKVNRDGGRTCFNREMDVMAMMVPTPCNSAEKPFSHRMGKTYEARGKEDELSSRFGRREVSHNGQEDGDEIEHDESDHSHAERGVACNADIKRAEDF